MVSSLSAALALLSATLPLTSGTAIVTPRQATGDANCQSVHIFLARGNNEPYPGRQGKLVTAICDGLDSCDYEDIQFYNPLEAPYCQSIEEGAANGTAQITAYNKRCPDAKLVVSGYSQGGHVVGDVLGGGGGTFFQGCQQKANAGLDATKAPGNKRKFACVATCEDGELLIPDLSQLLLCSSLAIQDIRPVNRTTISRELRTTGSSHDRRTSLPACGPFPA